VWSVTGDTTNLQVSENAIQADGYSTGKSDIDVPDHGNLGNAGDSYTFTTALQFGSTSINLNPADFAFMDSSSKLYNAVHMGNPNPSGDSIWVGSGPATVPEPASLAMLGFGLAALGFVRSRKAI
jgi:hypothetical protein